jgi:hypothetical protein
MSAFIGSLWFGLMLGLAGFIGGYCFAKLKKFDK